ncbi:MAG: hypothetical protein MZW92_49135 [Comamonadaceae bacterium]|nr:hypothetical protein [Comamonadaceae bacterium]
MTLRKLALCLSLMMLFGVAGTAAQEKVGKVSFPTSCNAEVQVEFDRAIAALHSFYHPASVNALAGVLQKDPACAMAHWGIAMNALGNPFGWPPSTKGLADGSAAVEKAKASSAKTERERDYIGAVESLCQDRDKVDQRARVVAYEQAMERLSRTYLEDREAAIFYALALNITASLRTRPTPISSRPRRSSRRHSPSSRITRAWRTT